MFTEEMVPRALVFFNFGIIIVVGEAVGGAPKTIAHTAPLLLRIFFKKLFSECVAKGFFSFTSQPMAQDHPLDEFNPEQRGANHRPAQEQVHA